MFSVHGKTCGLMVLWIVLLTSSAMAEPIPVATGEWIPYSSKTMDDYGTFTRRVTLVFEEMDMEPAYRFYPWQRCLMDYPGSQDMLKHFNRTLEKCVQKGFFTIDPCETDIGLMK